jgi:hypothetical protein
LYHHGAFLSPADADRPAPLPPSHDRPAPAVTHTIPSMPPVIPNMTPGGTVISGDLPLGFVPSGVPPPGFIPSPSLGFIPMATVPSPGFVPNAPVIPGVTTRAVDVGNPTSVRRSNTTGGRRSGSGSGDYPPLRSQTPFIRRGVRDDDDSSSDSANTLTTPPPPANGARSRGSSKPSKASYQAAPTPPGVVYPEASTSSGPTPRFSSGGTSNRRLSSATPRMGGNAPFLSFGTPVEDNSASRLPNGSPQW